MVKQEQGHIEIGRQQFGEKNIQTQPVIKNYNDYFSLLCRNGPLPQKYHRQTDFFCLIIYLILIVSLIVLLFINGISASSLTYQKSSQLKTDLFFGSKFFIWETIFSALAVLILTFILTILALYIPTVMAYLSILTLFFLSILFTIIQIKRYLHKQERMMIYVVKVILSILMILVLVVIVLRRKQKILNLGLFLQLSSKIIKSHLCLILTHMIALSLVQILIWYGFSSLYYQIASQNKVNNNFVHFITKFLFVTLWFWTSGALIAFSDYFTTYYTIHWFYHLSKQEQNKQIQQIRNAENLGNNQLFFQASNKYQSEVIRPIYKMAVRQIGTILFGSILAYLPLYFIAKLQKTLLKSSSRQLGVATFSKYGYLDTIMQWQNFMEANYRVYKLRNRIKSVMPQLYMLGHMYGDFTKLSLVLIGIAGIHQFVQFKSNIAERKQYFGSYIFTLLLFSLGLCIQIVTNFINLIGKCGDVAFFLYCIDLQVERVHYSNNSNYSTPASLMRILRQLTIKRKWKDNI